MQRSRGEDEAGEKRREQDEDKAKERSDAHMWTRSNGARGA